MSIGWFDDLPEANTYFTDERLVTEAWDALNNANKTKVIINGYNRLYYDDRWDLPTYAEATPGELARLSRANGEMAYYLAVHLADEDRRVGLQTQGVRQAGIVKEAYATAMLENLPVPPFVEALLAPWEVAEGIGISNLARDENESVTTKVHDW